MLLRSRWSARAVIHRAVRAVPVRAIRALRVPALRVAQGRPAAREQIRDSEECDIKSQPCTPVIAFSPLGETCKKIFRNRVEHRHAWACPATSNVPYMYRV